MLTVPNLISLIGSMLVVIGSLQLTTWFGLGLVVIGRLADLLDGFVARRLHQVSNVGIILDLTLDKLAGLAIIVALWINSMAPKAALWAIFVQNSLNVVASYLVHRAHPGVVHTPLRSGKYAMALQNVAMLAYALGYLVSQTQPSAGQVIYYIGHGAVILGVGVFGARATFGYFRRIRHDDVSASISHTNVRPASRPSRTKLQRQRDN